MLDDDGGMEREEEEDDEALTVMLVVSAVAVARRRIFVEIVSYGISRLRRSREFVISQYYHASQNITTKVTVLEVLDRST